jgi:monovalent cation:H+ antiporter, CPA1 family
MDVFSLYSVIASLAIFVGYLNSCIFKQQATIAIMSGSLLVSIALIVLQYFGFGSLYEQAHMLVISSHFDSLLLNGMLSFLLFAGALTIDFDSLSSQKWVITTLASISTICSAAIVGYLLFFISSLFGIHIPLTYCFLFGALISPTDPIAVLATFKRLGVSKQLTTCVAGESLFNDGVGIVLFITLSQLVLSNSTQFDLTNVVELFLQEAIGGIVFGLILGGITSMLAKPLKEANAIILLTLGVVIAGYSIALKLEISGPLAMVTAGILVNARLHYHIKSLHFHDLKKFWEIIDELLNAVLFLLLGFELLDMSANSSEIFLAITMIPVVLLVRLFTAGTPMLFFKKANKFPAYTIRILSWGGLRGGLAVALALSLPLSPYRDIILTLTYGIVIFAIIIQGSTISGLAKKSLAAYKLESSGK